MKKLIAACAALTLAACNGAGDDAETTEVDEVEADASDILEGDAPGFEAVAEGTYQVTRAGGEVDFVQIHPGMTFSRVDAEGVASGGSIFMKNGQTCFLAEGAEEEACFSDGPTQEDGSMETTSESGDISTVAPLEGDLEDHVSGE